MLTREQRADIERRLINVDKQLRDAKPFRDAFAGLGRDTAFMDRHIGWLYAQRDFLRHALSDAYIADVAELAAVEATDYRVDTVQLTAAINDAIAANLRKQRLTQQIAEALAKPPEQRRGFLKLAEVE